MGEQQEMMACLEQMLEGSASAFDRFYEHYTPFIMRIAWRMLEDRMGAEDICHDLFIDILHRRKIYDSSRGSIEAWLAVMTRSKCIDFLRRKNRVAATAFNQSELVNDTEAEPEHQVMSKLQKEALLEAMEKLPAAQQQAVVASFFDQITHREMSAGWQVPLGTVKSWVRYGLTHLRKELQKRGWADERRESR